MAIANVVDVNIATHYGNHTIEIATVQGVNFVKTQFKSVLVVDAMIVMNLLTAGNLNVNVNDVVIVQSY